MTTLADVSPIERSRVYVRASQPDLAASVTHDNVEAAGWAPTGDFDADLARWCEVYDLVVARRCVRWLQAFPTHAGAADWRAAVERYRARRRST